MRKRGLKRAASTVLASIKLSSLFKGQKRKNSVKGGVKLDEGGDAHKKRACAMLFKSKISDHPRKASTANPGERNENSMS